MDRHDIANHSSGHQIPGLEDQRVGPHPHCFHGEYALVPSRRQYLAGMGGVEG